MNKLISILLAISLLGFLSYVYLKKTEVKYTILMTGASFASPDNGWFELGAKELKARAINKAVSGETIADTANKMVSGELYTPKELDDIDALVIMQGHEHDVSSLEGLKENCVDYESELPFDRWECNYAATYDFVIKRYYTDCYNLKFNEKSKYYNSPYGKPVVIVLATHWHDSRPLFNNSIRVLAERWGFPVIEFDKNVGFSTAMVHPVTKEQISKQHTNHNFETMYDIEYGWHPAKGPQNYIQQRMAAVFADTMRKVLPIKSK